MNSFRALLVDDEEDFLRTVIKRLKNRDVNATGAGTGEDALRMLDQDPVSAFAILHGTDEKVARARCAF